MKRALFIICSFVVSACHPSATSPSGPGTVRLSVLDAPPSTQVNLYEGYERHGRRQFLRPGDVVCVNSPCETNVPPGSTFTFDSPAFPLAIGKMPEHGDAEAHVTPGSNLWQSLTPWTAMGGIVVGLVGFGALVDGYSRPNADTQIAAASATLGLSFALTAASFVLFATTKTKVSFTPLPGLRF